MKPKHTNRIFKLQCWMVGVNPKNVDGYKERWFMDHSWTIRRERVFIYLLAIYLYVSPKARRELTSFWFKTWKGCVKAGREWVWNYGWKYKEPGPKHFAYIGAFIGWLGIVIMLIWLAITYENKPDIPQYDAVWRGHYNP